MMQTEDENRKDLYPSPRMPLPPVRRNRHSDRVCRKGFSASVPRTESVSAMPGQRTHLAQRNSNQAD